MLANALFSFCCGVLGLKEGFGERVLQSLEPPVDDHFGFLYSRDHFEPVDAGKAVCLRVSILRRLLLSSRLACWFSSFQLFEVELGWVLNFGKGKPVDLAQIGEVNFGAFGLSVFI